MFFKAIPFIFAANCPGCCNKIAATEIVPLNLIRIIPAKGGDRISVFITYTAGCFGQIPQFKKIEL
jgi:hypothetical protein